MPFQEVVQEPTCQPAEGHLCYACAYTRTGTPGYELCADEPDILEYLCTAHNLPQIPPNWFNPDDPDPIPDPNVNPPPLPPLEPPDTGNPPYPSGELTPDEQLPDNGVGV